MSITTSSREWQSTTPINHMFVFKQGILKKKRSRCAGKSLRARSANNSGSKAVSETSGAVVVSNQQQSPKAVSQNDRLTSSRASVMDDRHNLASTPEDFGLSIICSPPNLEHITPMFDCLDLPMLQDFDEGNMFMPTLQIETDLLDQVYQGSIPTIQSLETPHAEIPGPLTSRIALSPLSDMPSLELLALCKSILLLCGPQLT